MSERPDQSASLWSRIGEDWGAVIIGLILTLLVYLGVVSKIPW